MREWLRKIWRRRYVTEGKFKVVAVGEGLYLKPYRKGYGFFLKHYGKGKGIKRRRKLISLLTNRPLSNIDIIHFAKNYISHF